MRAIIQRTLEASVTVDNKIIAAIPHGLLVLLGVEDGDTSEDAAWLAAKLARLRIFSDDDGKMNRSIIDSGGGIIVVSQFTLHASTRKGNRPSFLRSAPPAVSEPLYLQFCGAVEQDTQMNVQTGHFGADMKVALINDGPVTIFIDSRNKE